MARADVCYATDEPRFRYLNHNLGKTVGDGNIFSTVLDLQKFDEALFSGKLLKASTLEEAFTPVVLNNGKTYSTPHMDTMQGEGSMSYGLGWEIFEQPGYGKSVGHGGFKFGLATFYFRNLEKGLTIIAFDNTQGRDFGQIITSSLAMLSGKAPIPLNEKKSLVTLYGTTLVKSGPDAAAAMLNAFKSDTAGYELNEWEMNDLGYNLYYASTMKGHKALGLEVFKLATFLFPDGYNTYDSYGQLLKEEGKKDLAILMYRKSIKLNPDNEGGKRMLHELLQDEQ